MFVSIPIKYDETKLFKETVEKINKANADLNIVASKRVTINSIWYDVIELSYVKPENLFLLGIMFSFNVREIYPNRTWNFILPTIN